MLVLYIILGVILGLLVILILLAALIHHVSFGKRWDPDGIIKYYSPSDYEGLEEESIEIPTKKGKLRGKVYFYRKEEYKGIFIFSHGMWGSHRAYVQEMEILARNGFKVLGIDAFGTESSEGKNIRGLGNSLLTLDYAISYIKQIYPKENIYVMGHSWGGFAAANIAKYHRDLAAIVAMSPFISLSRILKHQLPKLLYPTIPFLILIDAMYCGKYSFANAKKTLNHTIVPTLILHSKDDPMVPYSTSLGYLKKRIKNQLVQYDIVDGKKHNPDYTIEGLTYTEQALGKLKDIKDKDERIEYRKTLDYHKMGELDENVFNDILDFLKLY
ncbi:MAG: lysophospholipase [Anaeroplasmataceae bacterium]|nr:lysophospholipase [Anaeroplasmataceae bacterium]